VQLRTRPHRGGLLVQHHLEVQATTLRHLAKSHRVEL
jgi:hypothetical protein